MPKLLESSLGSIAQLVMCIFIETTRNYFSIPSDYAGMPHFPATVV
ncbi:MAG: hypothetical protein ACI85I_001143, partial [Arenicella sp.]